MNKLLLQNTYLKGKIKASRPCYTFSRLQRMLFLLIIKTLMTYIKH